MFLFIFLGSEIGNLFIEMRHGTTTNSIEENAFLASMVKLSKHLYYMETGVAVSRSLLPLLGGKFHDVPLSSNRVDLVDQENDDAVTVIEVIGHDESESQDEAESQGELLDQVDVAQGFGESEVAEISLRASMGASRFLLLDLIKGIDQSLFVYRLI